MFSLTEIMPAPQPSGESSAYRLGHAYGYGGWKPRLPASFTPDEARDFEDGWRAGNVELVLSSTLFFLPDARIRVSREDEAAYMADANRGYPGDDACPDYLAVLTISDDDYYQMMAEATEEPDPWTLEEWDRKERSQRAIHDVERQRMGRTR